MACARSSSTASSRPGPRPARTSAAIGRRILLRGLSSSADAVRQAVRRGAHHRGASPRSGCRRRRRRRSRGRRRASGRSRASRERVGRVRVVDDDERRAPDTISNRPGTPGNAASPRAICVARSRAIGRERRRERVLDVDLADDGERQRAAEPRRRAGAGRELHARPGGRPVDPGRRELLAEAADSTPGGMTSPSSVDEESRAFRIAVPPAGSVEEELRLGGEVRLRTTRGSRGDRA